MICLEEWFSRWPCIVLCIALSFMNLTALEAKSDIRWMPQAGFYRVVKHFNVGTIRIKSPLTIHFCWRSIRDSLEEKIKLLHLFFGSAWLITESELQTQSYPDVCIWCLSSYAWKYWHSLLIPFGNGCTPNLIVPGLRTLVVCLTVYWRSNAPLCLVFVLFFFFFTTCLEYFNYEISFFII